MNHTSERLFFAESNQGNHSDFNRKWTITEVNSDYSLRDLALNVNDDHVLNEQGQVVDGGGNIEWSEGDTSYEHDLIYYYLITESEIEYYADTNSGHYYGLYDALIEALN